MELSADGQYITSTTGKSVYFWDAQTYTLRKQIKTEYDVSAVSLHPNHTRFVAGGSSDLWVRIYDFESGRELEVYKGHHGPVHTVSYSPDGELYATGSGNALTFSGAICYEKLVTDTCVFFPPFFTNRGWNNKIVADNPRKEIRSLAGRWKRGMLNGGQWATPFALKPP